MFDNSILKKDLTTCNKSKLQVHFRLVTMAINEHKNNNFESYIFFNKALDYINNKRSIK